jgi:hypothetical protein
MKVATFILSLGLFSAGASLTVAQSARYQEAYPTAASKKGLQVELVDDALALGVKHAALNFNLAQLIDPAGDPNNPSWEVEGRLYHLQRGYLATMDRQIKAVVGSRRDRESHRARLSIPPFRSVNRAS